MWWTRLIVVLGVVAVVGCQDGTTSKSVEPPSATDQIKPTLETVAESGVLDSGIMTVEEGLQEMKATDPAKAEELLKDLEELQGMQDPAQIKEKAQAMISKLE